MNRSSSSSLRPSSPPSSSTISVIPPPGLSVRRQVDVARFRGPFHGEWMIARTVTRGLPGELIANRSSSMPTRLRIVFIDSAPAPRGRPLQRSVDYGKRNVRDFFSGCEPTALILVVREPGLRVRRPCRAPPVHSSVKSFRSRYLAISGANRALALGVGNINLHRKPERPRWRYYPKKALPGGEPTCANRY